MARPDFFIIGAPKCGTTALSEYLRQHSRIGFSQPKEPIYFSTDFPKVRNFTEEADYLERCFGHCRDQGYQAIGEGSTSYFFSVEAIPNILKFAPEARFIAMLRNPLEMIPALHAQKLLSLEEDERDFARAWGLQAERAAGRSLPKFCQQPELLQYRNLGKLGAHVQRIMDQVPEGRLKLILFDDFAKDARRVYEEVLEFLGVPDDGRAEFPRINESKKYQVQALYELGHRPPAGLMRVISAAKNLLGIERLNIMPRLLEWNVRRSQRKPLSPKLRAELLAEFAEDIGLLERLLGRDLAHWRS
jgi:hypothetical protein